MPFLSSFGGAASIGFGLLRSGGRIAAYFYNNINNAWSNLGSWYAEEARTTPADFPTSNQTAYVLSDTEVVLDGIVDGNNNYTSWQNLEYWAPPAAITGIGPVDIKIVSYKFFNAPTIIPVFISGSGSYDAGDLVEYPSGNETYYEAKKLAINTELVGGVPNPEFWGYVGPQPYLPTGLNVTAPDGSFEFEGVNTAPPA